VARKRTKKAQKAIKRAPKKKPKSDLVLSREGFAERYKEDLEGLLPSEVLWVTAYLTETNSNGSKAAIMAGYNPKTAGISAHHIKNRPRVRALITKYMADVGFQAEDYFMKLKNIIDEDIATPLFEFLEGRKTLQQLKDEGFDMSIIKGIQKFENKDGVTWKIETMDKDKALATLGKAIGVFDDSMKIGTVNVNNEDNRTIVITRVPSVEDRRALPILEGDVIDVKSEDVEMSSEVSIKQSEEDEPWLDG